MTYYRMRHPFEVSMTLKDPVTGRPDGVDGIAAHYSARGVTRVAINIEQTNRYRGLDQQKYSLRELKRNKGVPSFFPDRIYFIFGSYNSRNKFTLKEERRLERWSRATPVLFVPLRYETYIVGMWKRSCVQILGERIIPFEEQLQAAFTDRRIDTDIRLAHFGDMWIPPPI